MLFMLLKNFNRINKVRHANNYVVFGGNITHTLAKPLKDSDKPDHWPSLLRLFTVSTKEKLRMIAIH